LGQIEETIADVGMEHEKNGLKVPTVLMPVYVMNVGALACSLLFGLRAPTFHAGSRSTICYCIVSVVHETPEVGQPGPSADEYVAMVTFAAKAGGATIAVHKETQKDSSAMPQRTHAY